MKAAPDELLKAWMQRVNHAEVAPLLSMYSESAVLIPTFSNRLLGRSRAIRDYSRSKANC